MIFCRFSVDVALSSEGPAGVARIVSASSRGSSDMRFVLVFAVFLRCRTCCAATAQTQRHATERRKIKPKSIEKSMGDAIEQMIDKRLEKRPRRHRKSSPGPPKSTPGASGRPQIEPSRAAKRHQSVRRQLSAYFLAARPQTERPSRQNAAPARSAGGQLTRKPV